MYSATRQKLFGIMHKRQVTLPFNRSNKIVSLSQDTEHRKTIKTYFGNFVNEARNNITKDEHEFKAQYDLYRQDIVLKVNYLMLVKTGSILNTFDMKYEGLFKIIKQLG
ncbi:unnamed protein product, partial [Rotaria sp. Silwood2]